MFTINPRPCDISNVAEFDRAKARRWVKKARVLLNLLHLLAKKREKTKRNNTKACRKTCSAPQAAKATNALQKSSKCKSKWSIAHNKVKYSLH